MPRKKTTPDAVKPIVQYTHADKERVNNPPVGLVRPDTDEGAGKQSYKYDPHLDPQLQWAGKAEHTAFEVATVSLHVHERIDPRTVIEAVRRRHEAETGFQSSLFASEEVNLPLFKAVEFYKHRHNWSNRMIAGDSLLVMNSLLVKEGMANGVRMVYFDPPYGIKYGSNFQPFVNKRDVKDGKDEDLTAEPETLKAFRDTWELGIHSYLTYLRDRLLLAREMLHESGSIFVQISDENLGYVKNLMSEVFGAENFMSLIAFRTKIPLGTKFLAGIADYLLWFAKDAKQVKFNRLFEPREYGGNSQFTWIELEDGSRRKMTIDERNDAKLLPKKSKPFRLTDLVSAGRTETCVFEFEMDGQKFFPAGDKSWKTNPQGMQKLIERRRIMITGKAPSYVFFVDDYPVQEIANLWINTQGASDKIYAVQTAIKVIQRCLLMTTNPSDLVLDITCGSGTTAFVAEQWGRRWITCDTSRVALTLAKQRLMTATFDYYQLAKPEEGISSGFKYRTVPHVTLGSITNSEPPAQETLYDKPLIDRQTARVTTPFTVEAVPAPVVQPLSEPSAVADGLSEDTDESIGKAQPPATAGGSDKKPALSVMPADASIARSGETLRQDEWRSELLRTGIRGRLGEKMMFSRVEPLAGTRYLHADAEVMNEETNEIAHAVVSFGPEHDPMDKAQVERAIEDASLLIPKPKFIIFAAFQFDPVAAQIIERTQMPNVQLLKAQMNADLLTDDLKKSRSSNESFWLIGQPDVQLRGAGKNEKGAKQYQIVVHGFDYYNINAGTIESGGTSRIAVWMLDTDFDGRSLFPHQVFFPMAGEKEGWARLARNLKSEINEELIEAYRGNVSLPFTTGSYKRIAVKIVDDRGIESLKLIEVV